MSGMLEKTERRGTCESKCGSREKSSRKQSPQVKWKREADCMGEYYKNAVLRKVQQWSE